MSYIRSLGPVTPGGDGWEVFICPYTSYAQIQVQNGAIDYQLAQGPSPVNAPFSNQTDTLLPGSGPILGPFHAIRFRNHVPVSSPVPQVSIRGEAEAPLGVSIAPGWVPSYVVVNDDGTISANFSGTVTAPGFNLQGVAHTPFVSGTIQWLNSAGGLIADIFASQGGGADFITLQGGDPSSGIFAELRAEGTRSQLPLIADILARAKDASGDWTKRIIGSDGTSDFAIKNTGVTGVTFTASNFSNTVTVNHGLGKVPILVLPETVAVAGLISRVVGIIETNPGPTSTQFALRGEANASFSGNVNIPWIAIG